MTSAQRVADSRSEVYAEAIALMRARLFEVEDLAQLVEHDYVGPSEEAGDITTARVLLVASPDVWRSFERFFEIYRPARMWRAAVELARRGGDPNLEARAALLEIVGPLRTTLDEAIDRMAKDVGTRRVPLQTSE